MKLTSPFLRKVKDALYDLGKNTDQVNSIVFDRLVFLSKLESLPDPDYKAIAISLAKKEKNS